jgi:hypothetical protein
VADSIFDPTARAALLARVDRLDATAAARWGKFTAPRMVSHCISAVRMALGEEPCKDRPSFLSNRAVRYLVIHVLPFPKGAPTAREMLSRAPESWPSDIAALKALIERAAANGREGAWARHPAFGALSAHDWGVLIHKHVNHHLTQFGA